MTLQLDLRAPILVLVAEFNPAIFSLPWIGRHILGKNEGDESAVTEVTAQTTNGLVQLSFFDGVAVNFGAGRADLFSLDSDAGALAKISDFVDAMIKALPHTPLTAIGCNLSYTDAAPRDAISDLFVTPEGFEGVGALNLKQVGVQMQMDGPEVLNFNRVLTDKGLRYTFNYHHPESDGARYAELLPNWIEQCIEHSSGLLTRLYGYEGYERVAFGDAQAADQGGDEGVD